MDKKIKVCHLSSLHPQEDVRIFKKECVSLARVGYDVYFVSRGNTYEKDNVHIIGLTNKHKSRIGRMRYFTKEIYRKGLEIDADIYHIHDPELLPYGLKLKKKGKKVIFDSHENYSEQIKSKTYLPKFILRIIAFFYKRFENKVLKKIDAVIFPCYYKGEDIFKNRCKRSAIIDNFPILDELYNKYDDKNIKNERSLCYIGNISYSRGIKQLIETTIASRSILYLAGNFDNEKIKNELKIDELECVNYLGMINRQQVFDVISKSKIGMSCLLMEGQYNKYDNLPTKAYEYMSLGVPVILTKAPYNEKLINQYGFGICVDPYDIEKTSSVINELFQNEEKLRLMGENGRKLIYDHLNWNVEKEKLIELYVDIIQE